MGRVVALAIVGALGFWAGPATAVDDDAAVVSLIGPSECLDAGALNELVERNSTASKPPDRHLRVRIERIDAVYRIELVLEESGVRRGARLVTSEGQDCHAEDASLGLIAAMLLEGPVEPGVEDEPASAMAPPLQEREVEESLEAGAANDAETPAARWGVTASAAVSLGLQPSVAPGALVGVLLELPRWLNVRAEAGYFVATSTAAQGPSVAIDRLEGGASLCGRLRPGSWQLETCAGGKLLLLRASGRGFAENSAADTALAAFHAAERLSWLLSRSVRIDAAVGISVPATQLTFVGSVTSGMELELFRTSAIAPQFELGASFLLD